MFLYYQQQIRLMFIDTQTSYLSICYAKEALSAIENDLLYCKDKVILRRGRDRR